MHYLTETQEVALRRGINELPERRVRQPAYPPRRPRGPVTLPGGQVIQPAAPLPGAPGGQVRIFPFVINVTNTRRNTAATPRMVGPVVVKTITFEFLAQGDPPSGTLELGWAPLASPETSALLTTPRPYTTLVELLDPNAQVTDGAGTGFPNTTAFNTRARYEYALGIAVTAPEVSLHVAYVNNSVSAFRLVGHIVVIEGASKEQVSGF